MREAAAELDFERAAQVRDDIAAMSKAMERSTVVLPDEVTANLMKPTVAGVLPSTVTVTNSPGEKVPLEQLNVIVAPGVMRG